MKVTCKQTVDLTLVSSDRLSRKIQDLEITNNSLSSLNAMLEDKIKLQQAEINSYKPNGIPCHLDELIEFVVGMTEAGLQALSI